MLTINGSLQAVALALLVLLFLAGVVKTSANLSEIKRPEHALKLFLRFAIAKGVVTYGLELMLAIFTIIQGVVSQIMRSSGITRGAKTTLPREMIQAIEDCGFFESIPLWAVTLIGSLFITVLSFVIIMTVYQSTTSHIFVSNFSLPVHPQAEFVFCKKGTSLTS